MALGNTPRTETNIFVEASKSYAFGIWFKAADGTTVDVSECTLRFVATNNAFRTGIEILNIEAVPVLDNSAMMQFEFQAEDLALDSGSYAYDVTLIPESGYSIPILKGQLEVTANADQAIDNSYTTIGAGTDLIVTLASSKVVEVTIERVDGLFMQAQELVVDFQSEFETTQSQLEALVAAAAASAQDATAQADLVREWFGAVGFPFWKGTQAEYDALPEHNPLHLYLIVEGSP